MIRHLSPCDFFAPRLGLIAGALLIAVCEGHAAQARGTQRPGIVVRDAWVRESTSSRTVSSGYLTIENQTEREVSLVGLMIEGVGRAEFHETAGDRLKATMRTVKAIRIPAHKSVQLEPGGTHVMLFDVSPPLVRERTVSMTLVFDDKQKQTIRAVVRPLSAVSAR